MKAQEQLRDSTLVPKAIFDIENPRFVWAVENEPARLHLGLSANDYLELKDDNSIWLVEGQSQNNSHPVARFKQGDENGVIIFESYMQDPEAENTIGSFNANLGTISNNQNVLFILNEDGTLSNKNGNQILLIGKEMNKKLVAFYLIDYYTKEAEVLKSAILRSNQ